MTKYFPLLVCILLQACEKVHTETVKLESVDIVVYASGELESKTTAMIAPPSVSQMWQYQIKQLIPENTKVSKGQVIVSFDDKKITERLIDKQAELDRAIKKLENKVIKETETEQELILVLAEKKMEYEKAQRKAEIVDNSRSDNDRRKSEIDFTIAENDLFLANEKLKFHKENQVLNLKLAQGKVERLTVKVNQFKSDINRLKVKAPIDGMVIYKTDHQGEKPAVGENTMFGQPIIELAVLEEMQLKAQINEPESGKIAVGQKVKITLDGTQELVTQGEVVNIGKVFRNKSSQDKRRIVDAIIALENTDSKMMRPGMTARVEIITETIKEALTLPTSAIKNINGESSVLLEGTFGEKYHPIKVAHVLGNKVLIEKGLAQGDVVAL